MDSSRPETPEVGHSSRPTALDGRFDALYLELRRTASKLVAREAGRSLDPSELVHEAYVKMLDQPRVAGCETTYFGRCFAAQCRRILVDRARARSKRARRLPRVPERTSIMVDNGTRDWELLELNDAIQALYDLSPRMAEIVDMRTFAGMTVADCAEALDVSPRTVDKDWKFARAWLRKSLS